MNKYFCILAFTLVALFCVTACSNDDGSTSVSVKKVLIDSDIVEGFDDGQAIMMLLQSPNVEVMGITSVTGNTWAQEGVAYGIRQMEICGATDVPIIVGSQFPLRRDRLSTLKDEVRKSPGRDSFWLGAVECAPVTDWKQAYIDRYGSQPHITPHNEDAVDFIIRTLKENPHEVILLALGPCTNIAKAIQKEPGIERLAKEIIYNGGSFYREGNTTLYAEFNVLYDPEAMGVCMRADFPKQTFVSLDVCEIVPMVKEDYMAMMDTIKNDALIDIFGGYWWLPKIKGFLMIFYTENQLLTKSCPKVGSSRGTKMGQNLLKTYLAIFFHDVHVIKDLCYSFAKVHNYCETNEGNPLNLSFAVHFSSTCTDNGIFG